MKNCDIMLSYDTVLEAIQKHSYERVSYNNIDSIGVTVDGEIVTYSADTQLNVKLIPVTDITDECAVPNTEVWESAWRNNTVEELHSVVNDLLDPVTIQVRSSDSEQLTVQLE